MPMTAAPETRERYAWGLAFLVLPLVLWELGPRLLALPRGLRLFVATPSQIVAALVRLLQDGELQGHFAASAVEFLVGLGLSVAVGLPLGVLLGRFPILDDLHLDPGRLEPDRGRLRGR
jgi:NitT/TauT family transport system permease protein